MPAIHHNNFAAPCGDIMTVPSGRSPIGAKPAMSNGSQSTETGSTGGRFFAYNDVTVFPLEDPEIRNVKHLGASSGGSVFLLETNTGREVIIKFAITQPHGSKSHEFIDASMLPADFGAAMHYSKDRTARKAAVVLHEVEVVQDILAGVDPSTPGYENIAKTYGSNSKTFNDDGLVYNVQEYGGCNLLEYLSKFGTSVSFSYEVLKQGCRALALLQAKQYAHFDIKVENFVVSKRKDGSPLFRLIDFAGCSKFAQGKYMPMTRGYTPPEHAGKASTPHTAANDAKFDIYSLGVIYMMTRCPRSVVVWNDAAAPVNHENLTDFIGTKTNLQDAEIKLMKGMLHKDPAQRWSLKQVMAFMKLN